MEKQSPDCCRDDDGSSETAEIQSMTREDRDADILVCAATTTPEYTFDSMDASGPALDDLDF